MKTIFCSFDSYSQAHETIKSLFDSGYPEKEMNVLIRTDEAKLHMDKDLHKIKVEVTNEIGEVEAKGLNRLVGGQRPLELEDIGKVYASGSLATIAAKTASDSDQGTGNLKDALIDLDVDPPFARTYRQKIIDGGVLFFIRVQDEKTDEAVSILTENKGENLSMVP